MAMEINIKITVDGDTEYTTTEAAVIRSLAAHPSQGTAAVVRSSAPAKVAEAPEVAAPAAEAPKAAAPAAKRAPATRAPKAATPKPVPTPDVPMALEEDFTADVPGDPQDAAPAEETPAPAPAKASTSPVTEVDGYKLKQPVSRNLDGIATVVTELVGVGKSALAKSALESAGVKRVSQIETDEQIATFFATLEG